MTENMDPKKILVIGAGSIGIRHIRNLMKLGADVWIYDSDQTRTLNVAQNTGASVCNDYARMLRNSEPDAAIICTPNNTHLPLAFEIADVGIDLFIEKPLSNTLDGVDELIHLTCQKKIIGMVGFMLRFEPGLQHLKKNISPENIAFAHIECGSYLPSWRVGTDYTKTYSANKRMGGGIILDDTHEIDYAMWIFGRPESIHSTYGRYSSLEIDVEDAASMTFCYPDKFVHIHADYLQRRYCRRCKICDREGYTTEWTFGQGVTSYGPGEEKHFNYKETFDMNGLYFEEMKCFLDAIRTRKKPESDLKNGREVMIAALKAKHEADIK